MVRKWRKNYTDQNDLIDVDLLKKEIGILFPFYDFKINNNTSEKYWAKRIQEFDNYHKKTIEYFSSVIWFIYICFYLLGILLIMGGSRKLWENYRKLKKKD